MTSAPLALLAARAPDPLPGKSLNFDASRSLFDAVAEMIGLMPMVRELEARLTADVEFKGGGA